MVSRRAFLTTGTASILILGISCASINSSFQEESYAAPWESALKGFGDVRLNALAYAILAPNPHNRQPWIIKLHPDGLSYDLHCDLDRLLPETDPPNRQITIGLGAFLELYKYAAASQGYRADIVPFPDGESHPLLDSRPIARVTLEKDDTATVSPLFDYTLARRTVRLNFKKNHPVTKQDLSALFQTAGLTNQTSFFSTIDAVKVARLKDISRRGWAVEMSTVATHHESTALTRIGAKEVRKNPDGISLLGPMMETYKVLGILRRDKMNTPGSAAFDGSLSFHNNLIDSAAAFGWLSTPSNTRLDQLQAGAAWVKLNLAATKLGIAMHPLSQVLQEFPEMSELYAEFHKEVGIDSPSRVQGLFRFGYAKYPKASPRWPLESRLSRVG